MDMAPGPHLSRDETAAKMGHPAGRVDGDSQNDISIHAIALSEELECRMA